MLSERNYPNSVLAERATPIPHSLSYNTQTKYVQLATRLWVQLQPNIYNSMFNLGISNCAKVGLKLRLPILHLKRTIVSRVINTITGHSPFRSHLYKLKLTDEPSCPKCGENSDCDSHFILKCPFYSKTNFETATPRQPK